MERIELFAKVQDAPVFASPNRIFACLLLSFLTLPSVVALLVGDNLSRTYWPTSVAVCSIAAGFVTSIVVVRRMAPWTTPLGAAGLVLQCALAAFILYAALISWVPGFTFSGDLEAGAAALWAMAALGSAWGIVRNRGWGYACEAVVIVAVGSYWASYSTRFAELGPFEILFLACGVSMAYRYVVKARALWKQE